MSMKIQLAELCTNRQLPMIEYKKLHAFSMLEQESAVIEKIEGFHLPEVTKLICGSEVLRALPWGQKYKRISPLYRNPENINVLQIILDCKTVDVFENEILCFADGDIVQTFKKYFDDLNVQKESKRKKKTILVKKISAEKKKAEEAGASAIQNSSETVVNSSYESKENTDVDVVQEVQLSADEKKLEELKNELTELDKYLNKHKGYIEKIHLYEQKVQEADSDENREKAYRFLNDVQISHEEAFLRNFISNGVVPEEYYMQLRDQRFVSRVLQCLEKASFKDYSLPVLLKLYDEGAVDLIEGPASDFLNQHPEKLCDYLVEKAPLSMDDLNNSELELLVEKVIQKELSSIVWKSSSDFMEFWNTINNQDVWRWVISKIYETVDDEDINSAISCFLHKLEGKAAKAMIEVLFEDTGTKIKVSTTEIISSLLKNSGSTERDVITEAIRLLEQNTRKIQRKLNTSERKLRSRSQELFSSVYLPMEQLEELAINLKLTRGEIKANLVATHLIDIVLSLREGLEALELLPVADTDDWKYQNKIKFDPYAHRVTTDNNCAPDEVRLRSLGFRYQDDDGEWQQYNAQASVEVDIPQPEKKVRKGYPKHEQPGKKNGATVHCKTSKKRKKGAHGKNKHRSEHKKK